MSNDYEERLNNQPIAHSRASLIILGKSHGAFSVAFFGATERINFLRALLLAENQSFDLEIFGKGAPRARVASLRSITLFHRCERLGKQAQYISGKVITRINLAITAAT